MQDYTVGREWRSCLLRGKGYKAVKFILKSGVRELLLVELLWGNRGWYSYDEKNARSDRGQGLQINYITSAITVPVLFKKHEFTAC